MDNSFERRIVDKADTASFKIWQEACDLANLHLELSENLKIDQRTQDVLGRVELLKEKIKETEKKPGIMSLLAQALDFEGKIRQRQEELSGSALERLMDKLTEYEITHQDFTNKSGEILKKSDFKNSWYEEIDAFFKKLKERKNSAIHIPIIHELTDILNNIITEVIMAKMVPSPRNSESLIIDFTSIQTLTKFLKKLDEKINLEESQTGPRQIISNTEDPIERLVESLDGEYYEVIKNCFFALNSIYEELKKIKLSPAPEVPAIITNTATSKSKLLH